MKRLRFIDDYCRVRHNSLSAPSQVAPLGRRSSPQPPTCFHMGHMAKAPHCLFTRLKHGTLDEEGGGSGGGGLKQPFFASDEVRV